MRREDRHAASQISGSSDNGSWRRKQSRRRSNEQAQSVFVRRPEKVYWAKLQESATPRSLEQVTTRQRTEVARAVCGKKLCLVLSKGSDPSQAQPLGTSDTRVMAVQHVIGSMAVTVLSG